MALVLALVASALAGLATSGPAGAVPFSRTETITIPGPAGDGSANPYPSTIAVSGVAGVITDVNVTLNGLTHAFPDDLDILLVGPAGQNLKVMSDAGGANPVSAIDVTLDDEAAGPLPDTTTLATGSYTPSNYAGGDADNFPAPAPGASAATALSTFDGTDPNGTWSLFVVDNFGGNAGSMTGWTLDITAEVVAVPGQLQFSASSYLGAEQDGTIPVTVTRTNGSDGAVSASFTTTDGTATAGSDYTDSDQTVSFADGDTTPKVVNIPVTDDSADEGINETIALALTSPTGGASLGTPSTATVQIEDNDSLSNRTAIDLPAAGATDGRASYYPSRIHVQGLIGNITDVNLTLDDLTHTFPDDLNFLVVGPGGQNLKFMSDAGGGTDVSAIDVTLDDEAAGPLPDSTVLATGSFQPADYNGDSDAFPSPAPSASTATALSVFDGTDPNGTWSLFAFDDNFSDTGTLAMGWTLAITSAPDPVPGQLQFSAGSYLGAEQDGTIPVTVTRTNGSDGAVSASFTTTDGTATAGSDYTDSDQTVSFADGDTTPKVVNIPVTDDSADEGINETIALALTSPTGGASLGTPSTATVQIEDNDSLSNRTAIDLPAAGATDGRASYYPSRIHVQGLVGTVIDVDVTLNGLTHDSPDDLDILLVGPAGQNLKVMSDAGGANAVSAIDVTLDDEAAGPLPDTTTLATGSYRPADYGADADNLPAPAPAASSATALSTFDGTDPNGTWSLFVVDNFGGNTGSLGMGWTLAIQLLPPPQVSLERSVSPAVRPEPGGEFTYSIAVTNDGGHPVTLDSMESDIFGDLDATPAPPVSSSTCSGRVGEVIAAQATLTCSFVAGFTGQAGDSLTDTVTVVVEGADGATATASAPATVSIVVPVLASAAAVGDSAQISGGDGDNCLVVDMPRPGVLRVTGCGGTLVNGRESVRIRGVDDGLSIRTGGGNDRIVVVGVSLDEFLTVETGGGSDQVEITTTFVGDSVVVDLGPGDDGLCLSGSTFDEDDVVLVGSSGTDSVAVESLDLPRGTILADLVGDFEVVLEDCD